MFSGDDVPGSPDSETYRWLLCGEPSEEAAWDWLGAGTSERIRHAHLAQACEYLADRLAGIGSAGTRADRMLLARSLFSSDAVSSSSEATASTCSRVSHSSPATLQQRPGGSRLQQQTTTR